jgi:hypothetical protein
MSSFPEAFRMCLSCIGTLPTLVVAGREVTALYRLSDEALARRGLVRTGLVQDIYSKHGLINAVEGGAVDPAPNVAHVPT